MYHYKNCLFVISYLPKKTLSYPSQLSMPIKHISFTKKYVCFYFINRKFIKLHHIFIR